MISMTVPVARRSLAHIPRRDLALTVGDGVALRLQLVETDRPDSLPVDILGLGPRLRMVAWRGGLPGTGRDYGVDWYGGALWSVFAVPHPTMVGQADIILPRGTTAIQSGSLGWELQFEDYGQVSTLCRGILQLRPGPVLAENAQDVLDDFYTPVLGDTCEEVVV